MKRVDLLFLLIFSVFLTTATASSLPEPNHSVESLDNVVATVNNEVITQSALDAAFQDAKTHMAKLPNPYTDAQLKHYLLEQLIDQTLQLQLAKHANMTITSAQLNQAIIHIAKANHLTVAQLKAKARAQGLSNNAYEDMIRTQMLIHQVQQQAVTNKVTVTPKDIRDYSEKFQSYAQSLQKFHVIDVLTNDEQQATQIMAQWKKTKIAPSNANDLGWQTATTLPTLFLDQLNQMKTGGIAGPIKAPNGYHVIQLLGVEGKASATLSKKQLQERVFQIKFQQAVQNWLTELRKSAYIRVMHE